MKPWEMFTYLKEIKHSQFKTAGNDVQYIITVNDSEKNIYIWFEESCGKVDWKNNLNFPVKIYKKQKSCLKAARGWGDAWKSCKDQIAAEYLQTLMKHFEYDTVICGWSYGGAVAVLAAEDIYYRTGRKPHVRTWGAPKVLWGRKTQKYVRSCCASYAQFTHVNDCVPLLPPFPGYCRLSTDKVGKGFSIFKLFNPVVYHQIYGEKEIYPCS